MTEAGYTPDDVHHRHRPRRRRGVTAALCASARFIAATCLDSRWIANLLVLRDASEAGARPMP